MELEGQHALEAGVARRTLVPSFDASRVELVNTRLTVHNRPQATYSLHPLEPRVAMDVCGLVLHERPAPRMAQAFLQQTRVVHEAWKAE